MHAVAFESLRPVLQGADRHGQSHFHCQSGAGATGRHVLLWFTNMGDGRVGPSYRVQVDELRLVG